MFGFMKSSVFTAVTLLLSCAPASAVDFDGSDDYINVGTNIYNSQTLGTIAAWIRYDSGETNGAIFAVGSDSDPARIWYFRLINNNMAVTFTNNSNSIRGNTTLSHSTWYHVALTSDNSSFKLFVNGVEEGITVVAGSNTGDWWDHDVSGNMRYAIGVIRRSSDDIAHLDGQIDDPRIYNRALSAAEVEALYSATRNRARKRPGGSLGQSLVGWWEMRGQPIGTQVTGSGGVIDSSGQSNHGTGNGGVSIKYSDPAYK